LAEDQPAQSNSPVKGDRLRHYRCACGADYQVMPFTRTAREGTSSGIASAVVSVRLPRSCQVFPAYFPLSTPFCLIAVIIY